MNPLQDLKDIRTPAVIENWPPAYGWWLLAVLIMLGVLLLVLWIVKFREVRMAKRQALSALRQINGSNIDSTSQLNQLLKRVAMAYFPEQNVPQMYGVKWTQFLASALPSSKAKNFSESFTLMQHKLYQPHTSENAEYSRYVKSVETWIKHALPPSKYIFSQSEQDHA
jgi:hypothetical protein